MGIKKYKHLSFFFVLFYLIMIGVDFLVFIMEKKNSSWFQERFIFYITACSPLILAYLFGGYKITAITFGITTVVIGGVLGLTNTEFNIGPPIFLNLGYWGIIDGFKLHKKWGIHILWGCLSIIYAIWVSYVKDTYFLIIMKCIFLYLVSIPISALMISEEAGKWVSGKLKE